MSYQHYFESRALKEYITALKWYKKKSDLAAANFVKEIDAAIVIICDDPFRFRNSHQQFREISLKKYPFYLIYTIEETKKSGINFFSIPSKKEPHNQI